jgi:hypothetical protein
VKLKKIGPCKILKMFGKNAYELELPEYVGISTIFNIADLYPYREDGAEGTDDQRKIHWEKQMSVAKKPQMENIVDRRVGKKTKRNTYFEYLVRWKA